MTTQPDENDAVSPDPRKTNNNLLLIRLWNKSQADKLRTKDLAKTLGVSYPYLTALFRGDSLIQEAGKRVLASIATHLGISVAQAYVWAGALTAEDFFCDVSIGDELANLYQHVLRNPSVAIYAPSQREWDALPLATKIFIAALYEEATGMRFLSTLKVPHLDDGRPDAGTPS